MGCVSTVSILYYGDSNSAREMSMKFSLSAPAKFIHPKYYKHLKKGDHQSHLGRQKMGWFLADKPVHQVKLRYLTK